MTTGRINQITILSLSPISNEGMADESGIFLPFIRGKRYSKAIKI